MRWWKRLILTVVSLAWGYISTDYLYIALGYLTGTRAQRNVESMPQTFLWQLAGVMAFDPCCLYEADPLPVSKG